MQSDKPLGPKLRFSSDPIRAAFYRYGNTASKLVYRYMQSQLPLEDLQRQSQAARAELVSCLKALSVKKPYRLGGGSQQTPAGDASPQQTMGHPGFFP